MLIGLGVLIHKFSVVPNAGTTVLAQLTEASLGHNFLFYAVQLITLVLLALAANTSFGGLPVLVPPFAVGAFVGFTLSQFGTVKHWRTERGRGWMSRAIINGVGAVLTTATTIIELISKFTEGAWLIVLVIPGLLLLFNRVHGTYARIGALLGIGQTPGPPVKHKSLVVVPVSSISRLIPEVQPKRLWDSLLFNQRGVILDRAIRRATANVVLCRLRYRLEQLAPHDTSTPAAPGPPAAPLVTAPPPA